MRAIKKQTKFLVPSSRASRTRKQSTITSSLSVLALAVLLIPNITSAADEAKPAELGKIIQDIADAQGAGARDAARQEQAALEQEAALRRQQAASEAAALKNEAFSTINEARSKMHFKIWIDTLPLKPTGDEITRDTLINERESINFDELTYKNGEETYPSSSWPTEKAIEVIDAQILSLKRLKSNFDPLYDTNHDADMVKAANEALQAKMPTDGEAPLPSSGPQPQDDINDIIANLRNGDNLLLIDNTEHWISAFAQSKVTAGGNSLVHRWDPTAWEYAGIRKERDGLSDYQSPDELAGTVMQYLDKAPRAIMQDIVETQRLERQISQGHSTGSTVAPVITAPKAETERKPANTDNNKTQGASNTRDFPTWYKVLEWVEQGLVSDAMAGEPKIPTDDPSEPNFNASPPDAGLPSPPSGNGSNFTPEQLQSKAGQLLNFDLETAIGALNRAKGALELAKAKEDEANGGGGGGGGGGEESPESPSGGEGGDKGDGSKVELGDMNAPKTTEFGNPGFANNSENSKAFAGNNDCIRNPSTGQCNAPKICEADPKTGQINCLNGNSFNPQIAAPSRLAAPGGAKKLQRTGALNNFVSRKPAGETLSRSPVGTSIALNDSSGIVRGFGGGAAGGGGGGGSFGQYPSGGGNGAGVPKNGRAPGGLGVGLAATSASSSAAGGGSGDALASLRLQTIGGMPGKNSGKPDGLRGVFGSLNTLVCGKPNDRKAKKVGSDTTSFCNNARDKSFSSDNTI